jgi:hypothetical protein
VLSEGFAILVRSHSCAYSLFIGGFLAGVIVVKSEGLLLFSLRVSIHGKIVPQFSLTEIKP